MNPQAALARRTRPTLRPDAIEIAGWLRARLSPTARLRADSRNVLPGDAFFAWPGHASDGRRFIADARARGASALVVDDAPPAPAETADLRCVTGLRDLAGEIAASWHGEPAAQVQLIAVTGTNGKTSCSQWIAQGLARAGRRAAVLGTLGSAVLGGEGTQTFESFGLTMPDALELHALLARFVSQGVASVVMEASSIGLDQARLSGAQPVIAVLTNLSRDHLDYHASMEAYAQAKLRLFKTPGLEVAVLNASDALSVQAHAVLPAGCRVLAYGERPLCLRVSGLELLLAERIEEHAEGLQIALGGDFGHARIDTPLLGRFNALNLLAVAGAWIASGLSFDETVHRLSMLKPVAGRLERVESVTALAAGVSPPEPCVVVDYAHTPDALSQVLGALRPTARARGGALWCVFGAGGDRDAGKRPLMGSAACQGADRIVLTSDNPRSESPTAIIAAIASGMSRPADRVEPDRALAIRYALAQAAPADVVLIAGKGHECWQEFADHRVEFSDAREARAGLEPRARSQPTEGLIHAPLNGGGHA